MDEKKRDIQSKKDIDLIVHNFYSKLRENKNLNQYFITFTPVEWSNHYNRMSNFWENILYHRGNYDGNPIDAHQKINEKNEIESTSYDTWIQLFCKSVDESFEGKNADKMKEVSKQIATIMLSKINKKAPF